jgi:hypothetical protein
MIQSVCVVGSRRTIGSQCVSSKLDAKMPNQLKFPGSLVFTVGIGKEKPLRAICAEG